jgi:hypothetical protein
MKTPKTPRVETEVEKSQSQQDYDLLMQQARQWALSEQSMYNNQLETSLETAVGTALVTLTVTKFNAVIPSGEPARVFTQTTNHLVDIDMTLVEHDRVKLVEGPGPKRFLVNGYGPVTFRFRIEDAKNETIYYPVGVAFQRRKAGLGNNVFDACARRTFSSNTIHMFGSDLYFTYDYKDFGQTTQNYEFFVIIQRDKDGLIGIIDPGIGHENE